MSFIAYLVGAVFVVFYVVPKALWLIFRGMKRYISGPEAVASLEATPEDAKFRIREY